MPVSHKNCIISLTEMTSRHFADLNRENLMANFIIFFYTGDFFLNIIVVEFVHEHE